MDVQEIREKQFRRRMRGFDPSEVAEFLNKLAGYTQGLQLELDDVQRKLTEVREELQEYKVREQTLEDTLARTRELAEEMKANGEREAQFMVAEAELQAEKILSQAHNRLAQIHDDISELKRQRAQFEVRLRSLVEAHLKLLDVEVDRDRELAELEDKVKILRNPST